MSMRDRALDIVAKHEGGWSNHENDRGGRTMFGITERLANKHGYDVTKLSYAAAKEILTKEFWTPCLCDRMPFAIAVMVFDFAIHSGRSRGVKALQEVLKLDNPFVVVDGIVGNQTIGAINDWVGKPSGLHSLAMAYTSKRGAFFLSLIAKDPTQRSFTRGWFKRLTDNLIWTLIDW